jgi:UDPglucose 6-dehydrogenase
VISSKGLSYAESAYEAAAGCDALLILTDWEEFSALDLERLRRGLKYPIVIDGRNLYQPDVMADHGFTYVSVGRRDVRPRETAASVGSGGQENE